MRAYQWLRYFDEHTKPRLPRRTDYRLLIFDGHKSHKARDFINFCEQNRIIPLCFPSKLTHRLQPLDSHPFLAYKHYYRKHNNQAKKWGGSVTEKADFLRSIHKIRIQTFTGSAVRHSFKDCGIWPFDPEVICEELRGDTGSDLVAYDRGKEYELGECGRGEDEDENASDASQPQTPPLASSSTINSPPTTVTKLRQNICKVRKSFPANPTPDLAKIQRRLEAIYEGSITQAELAAQNSVDISRILTNQEAASAPKSKRQVGKGGVLCVRDSNTLIQSRDIQEAEKQRRRWERDAKQKRAEICRQAEIRDQENQRRETEVENVTTEDGQPFFMIDRRRGGQNNTLNINYLSICRLAIFSLHGYQNVLPVFRIPEGCVFTLHICLDKSAK